MILLLIFFIVFLALISNLAYYSLGKPKDKEEIFSRPFPEANKAILNEWIPFYKRLQPEDKTVFENRIKYFWEIIEIRGVGLQLDDTCRLLVAASAVVPFWGLPLWNYGRLQTVLVYPDNFDWDFNVGPTKPIQGLVGVGGSMDRYMILSKTALYKGFKHPKNERNVGYHEFAHLLDKEDGEVDGIPTYFLPKEKVNEWVKLVYREMKRMKRGHSDINSYGLTNKAEFFAVVTEYFFEDPIQMKKKHPGLYRMMKLIYNNDTAKNKGFK